MNPKHETRVKDLRKHIAYVKANTTMRELRERLISNLDTTDLDTHTQCAGVYFDARTDRNDAADALKKVPAPRRQLARKTHDEALSLADRAAIDLGGRYSGDTDFHTEWRDWPSARTRTDKGERYSGSANKYRKTDATHIVTLDPEGSPGLLDRPKLVEDSHSEGMPLIALYPPTKGDPEATYRAAWVKTSKGKTIDVDHGWIAGFGDGVCYHSTRSPSAARQGLDRKRKKHREEMRQRRLHRIDQRRAELAARLCNGLEATIADAKDRGYCEAGIRQFQERYQIGDHATLPELMRTGDRSAIALAVSIARKYIQEHRKAEQAA